MENAEKTIVAFFDRDRKESEKAIATEKKQVSINPNCYIAKEIKYQTALLHELKKEIMNLKKEMQGNKLPR